MVALEKSFEEMSLRGKKVEKLIALERPDLLELFLPIKLRQFQLENYYMII